MTDTLTQREFDHVAEGLMTTHPKLAVFIHIGPVNAVWADFVKNVRRVWNWNIKPHAFRNFKQV